MKLATVVKVAIALLVVFCVAEKLRVSRADQRLLSAAGIGLVFADSPLQTDTNVPPFMLRGYRFKPLAEFTVRARVLLREDHYLGRTADLSPLDLALGWKRMADPAVYGPLGLHQSGRTLFISWPDPLPIPMQEIIESVANVHTIAANPTIGRALQKIHKGAFVRMAGKLVEVTRENWGWTSSLSRSDTGSHACEVMLVEFVQEE